MEAPRPVRPAAATIVLRRRPKTGLLEALFIKRTSTMRFLPGTYVFPGGVVDPGDQVAAEAVLGCPPAASPGSDPFLAAARHSALRELHEEVGMALHGTDGGRFATSVVRGRRSKRRGGRRAAPEPGPEDTVSAAAPPLVANEASLLGLVPFHRWVTPAEEGSRRFDTVFFLAVIGDEGGELNLSEDEVADAVWLTPADALARNAASVSKGPSKEPEGDGSPPGDDFRLPFPQFVLCSALQCLLDTAPKASKATGLLSSVFSPRPSPRHGPLLPPRCVLPALLPVVDVDFRSGAVTMHLPASLSADQFLADLAARTAPGSARGASGLAPEFGPVLLGVPHGRSRALVTSRDTHTVLHIDTTAHSHL